MIENRLFPLVEDMLDWTAKRQQTLSANIANIDTPGYRAKDVSFSQEIAAVKLATTSPSQIGTHSENSNLQIYETDAKVKDNGNSVDLDRQMTQLTKNGLEYVALIQYMNQRLKTLRTAINDGGRS